MFKTPLGRGLHNLSCAYRSGNFRLLFRMVLNYLSAYFRLTFWVPRPVELQIEPSSVCNLSCEMCVISKTVKGRGDLLTQSRLAKMLEDIGPLRAINFTGIGESLINRDLEAFIEMAEKLGARTVFITNGQLLTLERSEKLLTSGINQICFSLESGEPDAYENVQRGASFARLAENIKFFVKRNKELESNVVISLNVVLLKFNIEDPQHLYKIIDFARGNGISLVTFQNPHDLRADGTQSYYEDKKNVLIELFDSVKAYAEQRGIETHFPSTEVRPGSCYYPWVYPQITAAGELLPCCLIAQFGEPGSSVRKYSFGNVFKEGFARSWNSPRAKLFRKSLKGRQPNEFCRHCSKYLGVL